MSVPEQISSHRRLKELFAISEAERTEVEWDEINELEISLTPVNQKLTADKNVSQKAVRPRGCDPKSRSGELSKKPSRNNRPRAERR